MTTDSLPPASPSGSNDKLIIILCHLSVFLGVGLILPLVVYLVKKDSPLVTEHSREALNFHISLAIYGVVSGILCMIFIGILMLLALGLAAVICSILAAMKASEGGFYKYPFTLRLVS